MSGWAPRRFWTTARPAPREGGYTVELDARPVRTPAKAPLVVPTEPLASEIAAEWDAQGETIDPTSMPATRAANAAIDKVAPQRDAVVAALASYGATDLLCYRAAAPEALRARQAAAWDPLLGWAAQTLGARLEITQGVMPVAQPAEGLAALEHHVAAHGDFELCALDELVALSGSLVIALAVATRHRPAATLWETARLDESWQSEQWGVDADAARNAAHKRDAFLRAERFLLLARGESDS